MNQKFSPFTRRNQQFIVDGGIFACSFAAAYLIRFEGLPPRHDLEQALAWLPLLVVGRLLVNQWRGVYRLIWRFVCLADAVVIAKSLTLTTLLFLTLRLFWPADSTLARWVRLPLSVIALEFLLAFCGSLAVRAFHRILYERRQRLVPTPGRRARRLILYGAGRAGMMLLRELKTNGDVEVVGFVDDDPDKIGTVVLGKKVLGGGENLGDFVHEFQVEEAVIAMATASRQTLNRILKKCKEVALPAKIIPSMREIVEERVKISQFREVRIEDLLGRDSVRPAIFGPETGETYRTKRILVTGAAGSIGSELVRQLLTLQPESVAILDKDENSVYELEQELILHFSNPPIKPIIRDIRQREQLYWIFEQFNPHVVFHAAAHKHVPLMERHPCEAVLNNVCGTMNVLDACYRFGAERFVFISTDKAVNPTNIMGATKRVGERLVQAYAKGGPVHSACVRFGNVMGSRGSVLPLFERQIAEGGPITITHPDIVRFFMTIPEAVQLVLCAGSLAKHGEVFVLDMGSPRKILDLAREMVLLHGLEPGKDIQFSVTGLRPGEKMNEELVAPGEKPRYTRFAKLFMISPDGNDGHTLSENITTLVHAAEKNDRDAVYRILGEMELGFNPTADKKPVRVLAA